MQLSRGVGMPLHRHSSLFYHSLRQTHPPLPPLLVVGPFTINLHKRETVHPLVDHHTLIFASASVTIALGSLLQIIRIPADRKWRKLRLARNYLAMACFILGAFNLVAFFLQYSEKNFPIQSALILYIASYQALLFTMTLLMFIQPLYVTKKMIVPQFTAITTVGAILFLSLFLWESLFSLIFYTAIAAYLFQLLNYTLLFRRKYRACLRQLEEYYDEDKDSRLRWVQFSFYTALSIGTMALLSLFLGRWSYELFIVIYTAYYVYMTGRFLNYISNEATFVIPAFPPLAKGKDLEPEKAMRTCASPSLLAKREEELKISLKEWVEMKKFTQKDIGVEETAQSLNTDSYFLRYYFRTYMQCDFRTWRSELRIREAERILNEEPGMSVTCLCESVGFNDKGNFHRQFTKITGKTPTNYKQFCRDRVNETTTEACPLPGVAPIESEVLP